MTISIIIPALNEAASIAPLINYLKSNSEAANIKEIIVCDGGSTDATVELARQSGATVVNANKGRAVQMNTAAQYASGDILYFLHADTFPPSGFDKKIISRIEANSDAGCFIMKFDNNHPFMKFWGWMTQFTGPYFRGGDQSLFVTRKLYHVTGGYNASMKIMEDYDFVHRLMRETKFAVIPDQVVTSARKYEKVGMYKLQLKFARIYIMYLLGCSQQSLLTYYSRNVEKL